MTTAPVVAEVASALDPALPGLAAALSERPPGTAAGDDCRVHHVEWSPGRRCRVVHEIRSPGRTTTFVATEVTRSGTAVRGLDDDSDLPGLPVALDPQMVADRLAELCPAPLRACRITPVG